MPECLVRRYRVHTGVRAVHIVRPVLQAGLSRQGLVKFLLLSLRADWIHLEIS
jgi:hypothetical protein